MVKFLTQVLGPIFTGLGVSEADLKSYITQLQGYIYVILAALVVMIVVLFAASKAKKRIPAYHPVAGSSGICCSDRSDCQRNLLWSYVHKRFWIFKCLKGKFKRGNCKAE